MKLCFIIFITAPITIYKTTILIWKTVHKHVNENLL